MTNHNPDSRDRTDAERASTPVIMAMMTGEDRLNLELTSDGDRVLATAARQRASWERNNGPTAHFPEDLATVADAVADDTTTTLSLFECQRAADAAHWYAGELTRGDFDDTELDTALELSAALRRFVQSTESLS